MHHKHEIRLLSTSPEMTQAVGALIASVAAPGDCIPLIGAMGSGKTTFVQGFAMGLGVPDTNPVASPSFTLINQYRGKLMIHHVDLYRLNETADLDDLELDDLFRGDSVTILEWPQLAIPRLPGMDLLVQFEWQYDHEFQRNLLFRAFNNRYASMLERLEHDFSGD